MGGIAAGFGVDRGREEGREGGSADGVAVWGDDVHGILLLLLLLQVRHVL